MAQIVLMCMNCQQEFPEVNAAVKQAQKRTDISFSHGVCRRHFVEFLKNFGKSDEEIKAKLATMEPSKVPDLKEHPELVKQYSQGVFLPEDLKQTEFPTELKEYFKRNAGIL